MPPLLSAILGAGVLSGSISYHIAQTNFEFVTSLSEWYLNRLSFTGVFYILSALIGVILMTAGRRGSEVEGQVQKHSDSIATFYASASGSVLGWVGGVCLVVLLDNPESYWFLSIAAFLMVGFTVVAPLVAMKYTRQAISEFNNKLFRIRSREPYIRLIGFCVLTLSIVFFIYEISA